MLIWLVSHKGATANGLLETGLWKLMWTGCDSAFPTGNWIQSWQMLNALGTQKVQTHRVLCAWKKDREPNLIFCSKNAAIAAWKWTLFVNVDQSTIERKTHWEMVLVASYSTLQMLPDNTKIGRKSMLLLCNGRQISSLAILITATEFISYTHHAYAC